MIPSCQLIARQLKDKPVDLEHEVMMDGAKGPHNKFTMFILGKVEGEATTPRVAVRNRQLHHYQTERLHPYYQRSNALTFTVLLRELSRKVSSIWEDIGLFLEIDSDLLDTIKEDHHYQSKDCFKEMIKLWLKQVDPPPTWSAIIEAIRVLGHESLAENLSDRFL